MRKIVHIDMDAFYVSVEIRDNPTLAGQPVAVGGKSDKRGVLSTCNYIARQFGVSSAMPTAIAKRKCPDLIVVPGRMDVYKAVSQQIRAVFERYTDKIEPLSLDEAYLDLSDSTSRNGSATLTAQDIRADIYAETKLTASAGIAGLKFLAKIASDINKPNGQFTISPEQQMAFITALELRKIPGVGKVTQEKLAQLGLRTCGDVQASSQQFMMQHFGKYGAVIWARSQGIDDRNVEVSRIRKSLGVERTFAENISQLDELKSVLADKLLPELELRAAKYIKARKITKLGVKIKFMDFQLTTKEQKHVSIDLNILFNLLEQALIRGKGKSVRLLGIHIGLADDSCASDQLSFQFE